MDKLTIIIVLQFFLLISIVSAISVNSINVETVSPGGEGIIRVEVENDGNNDIELLSFNLKFEDSGIIPLGSSEAFFNRLEEDEEESFAFRFKVANTLPAGTYTITYVMSYEEEGDEREQTGSIGVIVSAQPEIEIIVDTEEVIIGQQTTINIRVINKGLADARFVSLSLDSEDITFLNENSEYIGTIDSDDFEVSSFDIIYNNRRPNLEVKLEYKDFDNKQQQIERDISLKAYTREEALDLGLISRNNTMIYILIILAVLVIWYILRRVRKNRKKQKERELASR
ncbi:MAG: hypothetical protein AABX23_00205 [Nanoarchaeota archaeon]